jgi:3-dehydrotetronate 4-kinase
LNLPSHGSLNAGPQLGCIADDFTGATDLASTLVAQGMRTVVLPGEPVPGQPVPQADALVVALKSRSIPAADAIALSLASLRWLQQAGCRQFFFKYCSTFDSTDAGNIGPVAEALLDALGAPFTLACPAFPANARSVYRGYLFVGDRLLSESGMRDHPLTPMTDPSLVRVLSRQLRGEAGLVGFETVEQGAPAVLEAMRALQSRGIRVAIADALSDRHLMTLGEACAGLALVTGGSGMAMGLPANFRALGWLPASDSSALPPVDGYKAVIAGSCSTMTREQVAAMRGWAPSWFVDPATLYDEGAAVMQALDWARPKLAAGPVLLYSTAAPDRVAEAQRLLGADAGPRVERVLAGIAHGLAAAGVRRLVVAGGETSGAVVGALGVRALRIGPVIAPGVPWTASDGGAPLWLALKSGNFGAPDFFRTALDAAG